VGVRRAAQGNGQEQAKVHLARVKSRPVYYPSQQLLPPKEDRQESVEIGAGEEFLERIMVNDVAEI
jgi:hypothetical protein